MNLTVILVLEEVSTVAVLSDDDGPRPDSYLGMDPLGRPGTRGLPARRVVLYRGLLPRNQLDTDALEGVIAAQARVTVAAPARTGRAETARGDDTETTQIFGEPDTDRELEPAIKLGASSTATGRRCTGARAPGSGTSRTPSSCAALT